MGSLERNSFSFVEFYIRRIKRIFPALLLVLAACFAFGWFVLLADEYKQLGKHIAGGAGFISNYLFWGESGYFDNAAETKPLLHLWSLGIEEQFYIVWPLLLWFVWKNKFNLLTVTLLIAFISFGLNVAKVTGGHLVDAFYSPQTRFWELFIGSILAYTTLHHQTMFARTKHQLDIWLSKVIYAHEPEANGKTLRNVQTLLGATFFGIGFVLITREGRFPGWWAVLPTLGAVLIISAGTQAWFNRVVLSHKVLVWFGLISFPLYLWHWPLLSFARIMESETPSREIRIAAVLISILLAWLTYIWIEKPVRFGKYGQLKALVAIALMATVGIAGYVIYKRDGLSFRAKEFFEISVASGNFAKFNNFELINLDGKAYKVGPSQSKNTTLFIGDSNAEQYAPRIEKILSENPEHANKVIFGTESGCSPIPHVVVDEFPWCSNQAKAKILELVRSDKNISTIVFAAFWPNSLSRTEIHIYFDDNGKRTPIVIGNPEYKKALSSLARYIEELKLASNNARIVIVLNTPFGNELDPKFVASRSISKFPNIPQLKTEGSSIDKIMAHYDYGAIRKDLIMLANESGADVIDPISYLCDLSNCSAINHEGHLIFADSAHLNATFSRDYARYIDEVILVNK